MNDKKKSAPRKTKVRFLKNGAAYGFSYFAGDIATIAFKATQIKELQEKKVVEKVK
tara:strand:- start:75 stop:242 length:168 start_codon:yes stop_codon:yes gene_type:complete